MINDTTAKKEQGPIHVSGVILAHKTPNPQRSKTTMQLDSTVQGDSYISLTQNVDGKHQLVFFSEDWKFIRDEQYEKRK